jgi:hypothetical protein
MSTIQQGPEPEPPWNDETEPWDYLARCFLCGERFPRRNGPCPNCTPTPAR